MSTIKKLRPLWDAGRTALLTVAGFGSLTAAAWTLAVPAGLAVAGVSFLLLEYLSSDGGGKR